MNYPNYGMPEMQGFGMPEFKGTWINKNTGATVIVRDTVLMDEGMTVILSNGEYVDMNTFSNDYYQMSDEAYDMSGNKISNRPIQPVAPPRPPKPMPTPTPAPRPEFVPPTKPDPDNAPDYIKEKGHMALIEKLFKVKNPIVTAKASLDTEDFPKDELQMLIDVYGVHINDIAAYVYKTWYTSELVINMIKEYLVDTQGLKEPNDEKDDTTNP